MYVVEEKRAAAEMRATKIEENSTRLFSLRPWEIPKRLKVAQPFRVSVFGCRKSPRILKMVEIDMI